MAERLLMILLLIVLVLLASSAPCPEGSKCINTYTSCLLHNGSASYCQLPNAICCPGGNACCPAGEACVLNSCFEGVRAWPFVGYKGPTRKTFPITSGNGKYGRLVESQNTPTEVHVKKETECPDKTLCQVSSTCCPANPSGYVCCPIKNAVCCVDQVHCCPHNTICSSDSEKCLQIGMTVTGHNTSIRIEMFPPSFSNPSLPSSSTPLYTYFPSSFLWLAFLFTPSLSSSSVSSCAPSFLSLLLPLFTHYYYGRGVPSAPHA